VPKKKAFNKRNTRRKRKNDRPRVPDSQKKADVVEVSGTLEEVLPNAQYRVRLEGGQEVLAHVSGRMRLNRIRVLTGDQVTVQMSPYDLTRGRIVRRER